MDNALKYADSPLYAAGVEDAVMLARAIALQAGKYDDILAILQVNLETENPHEVGSSLYKWRDLFNKALAAARQIFVPREWLSKEDLALDVEMDPAEALELLTKTPFAGSPLFRARDTAVIGFVVLLAAETEE